MVIVGGDLGSSTDDSEGGSDYDHPERLIANHEPL